jgi:hypothetical protein
MFHTMVNAVISRGGPSTKRLGLVQKDQRDGLKADKDATLTDLERITNAIIKRRLQKIDGLRVHLRRSLMLCWSGSGAVVSVDSAEGVGESMRSPITRLNAQQSLLMGRCPLRIRLEPSWRLMAASGAPDKQCNSNLCTDMQGLSAFALNSCWPSSQ